MNLTPKIRNNFANFRPKMRYRWWSHTSNPLPPLAGNSKITHTHFGLTDAFIRRCHTHVPLPLPTAIPFPQTPLPLPMGFEFQTQLKLVNKSGG